MTHVIPRADNAFNAWLANFTEFAAANAGALGLSPADITDLQNLMTDWQADLESAYEARAAYKGAIERKQDSRKLAEQKVRELAQRIQHNPEATDVQRAGLGIKVKDRTRTLSQRPVDAPFMAIDFATRHWHFVHWGPHPQNERINGKPKGVYACEIRYLIGTPPPGYDQEDLPLVQVATKSPVIIKHEHYGGQPVYYTCRYLNTRMEPGPWGEVKMAIVGE